MLAYLVAADLPKEKFIRTVSTMYFIGSFPLYGSLIYYGFATKQDLIVSLALIIPAFISQQIGTKIRDKINQKQYQKHTSDHFIYMPFLCKLEKGLKSNYLKKTQFLNLMIQMVQ